MKRHLAVAAALLLPALAAFAPAPPVAAAPPADVRPGEAAGAPSHPGSVPKEQATGMGRNLRLSEPVTLRSLSGPVLSVTQEGSTLYIALKDGAEDVQVQLGPASYIAGKKVAVAVGDRVEVKGAKAFLVSGGKALVATDLYKGGVRVKLREEDGSPAWGLKGGCRNCKGGGE